jgi:hypothetical protein
MELPPAHHGRGETEAQRGGWGSRLPQPPVPPPSALVGDSYESWAEWGWEGHPLFFLPIPGSGWES